MSVFDIIVKYQQAFLGGLEITLKLALLTWVVGIVLGSILGILAYRFKILFGIPVKLVSFVLMGIPLLVFLYWAHYPLQVILSVNIAPFYTALGIFITLNLFGVSEIVRSALNELPNEYVIAGKVAGLSKFQIVRYIQFPLIIRQILPGLLNLQVIMLQMTLFASLISVEELFRVAQRINATIHKPIEIYSALAIFFLMICLPLNGLAYWLKFRFTRKLSEN